MVCLQPLCHYQLCLVDNHVFINPMLIVVWWLQVQQSQVTSVLSEPQRALLSTISAGHQVITTIEKELITKAEIPELGSDPVCTSPP